MNYFPVSVEEAEEVLAFIAARFFTPYPLLCGVVGLVFETDGVVIFFPLAFPSSSFSEVAMFFDPRLDAGIFSGVAVGDDKEGVSIMLATS